MEAGCEYCILKAAQRCVPCTQHITLLHMPISALSHITFICKDIDRTAKLWCEALLATEIYDSRLKNYSLSREKYFLLGGVWIVIMALYFYDYDNNLLELHSGTLDERLRAYTGAG
jgi:fosfomycin resistance protein FosX